MARARGGVMASVVIRQQPLAEPPPYFWINGLAMSVFGVLIYYSRYSVEAFGLSIAALISLILAIVTEAAAKNWYSELANFVTVAFPSLALGYFAAPYIVVVMRFFADVFVGFGKYLVSLIDPSRAIIIFPVVAAAIPLITEAIAVFVRSAYFSITLSLLGYPVLAFAVSLPLAVGLVAFISYVYVSYMIYVVSVAIVVSVKAFINLLDTLAFLFGLAVAFGAGVAIVRFVPDFATALSSSIVGLAGDVEADFREGVKRFYVLSIFNYVFYFVLGYAAYVKLYDWYALMSAAIAVIATADLSLMSFYMLRQYPNVSPRLARRVVYLASGVEAIAMLVLVMSNIGIDVIFAAVNDTISRLIPFYNLSIEEVIKWILRPL